jgi:hypothetical protein
LSPASAFKAEYKKLKSLLVRSREEEQLLAVQTINIIEQLVFEEAEKEDNNNKEEEE